jgi:hypothetical protein
MNLIAFCKPTHVYRSDSCPFALGGYSDKGFAWHFEIPEELCFRASNNLLEYIASIITPWVDMVAGRLNRGNCALLMTDSSTPRPLVGSARPTSESSPELMPTQSKHPFASTWHSITPHFSLMRASRSIPSGSRVGRTTLPMLSSVILTVPMTI